MITKIVLNPVLMVRVKVAFIESLKSSLNPRFG